MNFEQAAASLLFVIKDSIRAYRQLRKGAAHALAAAYAAAMETTEKGGDTNVSPFVP